MPGSLLIIVEGDRGVGKSTKAAELARQYPRAVVVEEHGYGTCPGDREIGRQRFRSIHELGQDWYRGLDTAIVVGGAKHHKLVVPVLTGGHFLEVRRIGVESPV